MGQIRPEGAEGGGEARRENNGGRQVGLRQVGLRQSNRHGETDGEIERRRQTYTDGQAGRQAGMQKGIETDTERYKLEIHETEIQIQTQSEIRQAPRTNR